MECRCWWWIRQCASVNSWTSWPDTQADWPSCMASVHAACGPVTNHAPSIHSRRTPPTCSVYRQVIQYGMVWYVKCRFIYSTIITKVSNMPNPLVSGEKPGFQALFKGLIVVLCAEVVRQGVPDHGAVHSKCSASNSG